MLLKAGANSNKSEEKGGMAPLHFAILSEQWKSVAELIAHGADLTKKDKRGRDATACAVEVAGMEKFHQCQSEAARLGNSLVMENAFDIFDHETL